jgi:hypothetical protein
MPLESYKMLLMALKKQYGPRVSGRRRGAYGNLGRLCTGVVVY